MEDPLPDKSIETATVQEAIDLIVQSFGYPESLSLDYTVADGQKRTLFEVSVADGVVTYELRYNGHDDESEPQLSVVE